MASLLGHWQSALLWFTIYTVLDPFSQEQLTFPPFTPNRVVTQHYFCRTTRGELEEQAPAHIVHRPKREHSSKNLHRRVVSFSRSAIFVWFSSSSRATGRGSVMAYTVGPQSASAGLVRWVPVC